MARALKVQGLMNVQYAIQGDEIYVRAKIVSSKVKTNPGVTGEVECAWTQPVVNVAR